MRTEGVATAADAEPHLDHIVIEIVQMLERQLTGPADVVLVRELVEREWAGYDDARVRTFVPVLVRRAVIGEVIGDVRRPPPDVPG